MSFVKSGDAVIFDHHGFAEKTKIMETLSKEY
jgi:hypothetical protein